MGLVEKYINSQFVAEDVSIVDEPLFLDGKKVLILGACLSFVVYKMPFDDVVCCDIYEDDVLVENEKFVFKNDSWISYR